MRSYIQAKCRVCPIIDSATVLARIGDETTNLVPREEFGGCPSVNAVWMQMQMLQVLDGSEDNPLPGGKQANPRHAVDQLETVTPGFQRTPSPAVILLMTNPFAVPYSTASAGNSGSVPIAISEGPAPESVAAIQ